MVIRQLRRRLHAFTASPQRVAWQWIRHAALFNNEFATLRFVTTNSPRHVVREWIRHAALCDKRVTTS